MSAAVGLGKDGAGAILAAYEEHREAFRRITRRARQRFVARDWVRGQVDSLERLLLYRSSVEAIRHDLTVLLGDDAHEPAVWRATKREFTERIAPLPDVELAETFFNSITRKVFTTVGVSPEVEFVDLDPRRDRYGDGSSVHKTFERAGDVGALLDAALASFDLGVPWRDRARDARLLAQGLEASWRADGRPGGVEALDLIDAVFYRGSGAYLVGRARGGGEVAPLILVLLHGPEGIEADAVLATESEVSIVFSFTRSHFHVDLPRPADVVRFLRTIMPRKPLAELYICLGQPKHGKTEMYRDLMGHLRRSLDPFDLAPGDPGMVMAVFTQRSYDYVFKVIRDRFAPPKTNTRQDVMDRYQLVFRHDRAGRLIEAQEFEHLIFERRRFTPALLAELAETASRSVTITDEEVHIKHLYAERRVRPLNLFLREADDDAAARAVRDYGQAIRDLATTNIFPGDMLLKNFGVTRHGRVIFYDYDELCLLTECNFRELPTASDDHEEMAAEPWFYVGEHDVFPEEFGRFLGLPPPLRAAFLAEHAALLTPDFWRALQRDHEARRIHDVFPYPPSKRLSRA